jgi:hypothetical protein
MCFRFRTPHSAFRTELLGEPAGIRTQDTRLKRAVLYQLSYRPIDLDGRGVYYQRNARSVNKKHRDGSNERPSSEGWNPVFSRPSGCRIKSGMTDKGMKY